ncbi:integrase catalytic domain-containing protein [Trichonephila clavata]|uniref:Integrase catalytic domain-containing protein n=1 Tax=Trichonephila clavata TaxID=2740835 RepID=A0A8X6GBQ3_TRICU|nr:integrase catalytic domain-containing protein [Trichonephila clavata]
MWRYTSGVLRFDIKRIKAKHHLVVRYDMGADCPKIDILIGSDNFGKILTGRVRQLKGGLTAVCTKLGWVVRGASDEIISKKDKNATTLCASLVVHNFNIFGVWRLSGY